MFYRHMFLDAKFVKKTPPITKPVNNTIEIIDLCEIDDKDKQMK